MMLNKSKGNMYSFVTHTWNTVKGKCPHDCAYCYCKRWGKQSPLHFDEKELKTDLGSGNFIFVGSSCDLWAKPIFGEWISKTLNHCLAYKNRYLFQTKNPARISSWKAGLPHNCVIGTTIETNRVYPEMGNTVEPFYRVYEMNRLSMDHRETMVTIEPVMDFDLFTLLDFVEKCHPSWVNIGANTRKEIRLTEPPAEKVLELITELRKFTDVKIKKNLYRIIGKPK